MTGHERKHNACRADFGVCVSGYTYISRVTSLQNVCRGSAEGCNQAHAGACPQNQAQDRQARDRRAEAALPGYLYVLESSVWVCGKSAYKLTIYKLSYCCMTMLAPAPASLSLKAVLTTIRRMLLPQGCVQE